MVATPDELRQDIEIAPFVLQSFTNLAGPMAEATRAWRNGDAVRQWMYSDHFISGVEHQAFLRGLATDSRNFWWLIHVDGLPIAVLNVLRADFRNGNAYWGFYVNPDLARSGIGWIAEYLGPSVVFDIAGFRTLKLEVLASNSPVINLHKGGGFQEEGRLREFVARDSGPVDVVIMGMMESEWRGVVGVVVEKAYRSLAKVRSLLGTQGSPPR